MSTHYRFSHAARMEWIKLRSLRSTWWTLAVTIAGAVAIAVAVGANTRNAAADLTNNSLAGVALGLLAIGALGAVVLADTRRLADSYPSIDYIERRGTPFIVAVNCFHGEQPFEADAVRNALALDPNVPLVMCDVRDRRSGREVLISLIEHVRTLTKAPATAH
jgi:hypothetical protein